MTVIPRVGGGTRTAGVMGWPVDHSLSPVIHNAAFAALGLEWVYVPLPVPPGRLAEALAGLSALGFGGVNVTMPHKTGCAEIIPDLSEDARRLHAVNTIVITSGGLSGHNTDAPGFERFLRGDVGFEPAGRSALLLGAGGAARACALALARAGLSSLTVAVRDPSHVAPLLESLGGFELETSVIPFDRAEHIGADLLVNATPVGARGEVLVVPEFGPGVTVVDLLYRPRTTPLLDAAREAGAPSFGGLGLLLHQAALSFELWTGQPAPLGVMSAAALAALADEGDEGPAPRA